MKLAHIYEGSFGDLMSLTTAKLGSSHEDKMLVNKDQRLYELVELAKTFQFSLFDAKAGEWWDTLFTHFGIPKSKWNEVFARVSREIKPKIDMSLYESAAISRIADFLNPRTRQSSTRSAAATAMNARAAITAIGMVARLASSLRPVDAERAKEPARAQRVREPEKPREKPENSKEVVRRYAKMIISGKAGFGVKEKRIKDHLRLLGWAVVGKKVYNLAKIKKKGYTVKGDELVRI